MAQWKFITKSTGYKGVSYYVSDTGLIKTVTKNGKTKIYSGYDGGRGYRCCTIGAIHRLVAEAFVPNPEGYTEVDHIDGNPSNNAASNLRWCTHQQNMRNPNTLAKKRRFSPTKKVKVVQQFSLDGQLIKEWKSEREIARAFGVSSNRFNCVIKKKNPVWRGYIWRIGIKEIPRYRF